MAQPSATQTPQMQAFQQALRGLQKPLPPDNPLIQAIRRYNVIRGSECGTLLQKSENIDRWIRAQQDSFAQAMRQSFEDEAREWWIATLTITRETCVAILDMAGSILPAAEKPATIGVALIDTASTVSERAHRVGDTASQGLRTANTANSFGNVPGRYGSLINFSAQQAIEFAQGYKGISESTTTAERHSEAAKLTVSVMAEMVKSVADATIPQGNNSPGHPGRVVGGVATAIKSGYNYDQATQKAFDDYYAAKNRAAMDRAVLERSQAMYMQRWRKTFAETKSALDKCVARLDLS